LSTDNASKALAFLLDGLSTLAWSDTTCVSRTWLSVAVGWQRKTLSEAQRLTLNIFYSNAGSDRIASSEGL
jgi:hypothetical protein